MNEGLVSVACTLFDSPLEDVTVLNVLNFLVASGHVLVLMGGRCTHVSNVTILVSMVAFAIWFSLIILILMLL